MKINEKNFRKKQLSMSSTDKKNNKKKLKEAKEILFYAIELSRLKLKEKKRY
jgi:hypothetical protein